MQQLNAYFISDIRFVEKFILDVLAGKVAADEQTIDSISDATELYEHYYKNQIAQITNFRNGICTAGIIAFFQQMDLDNLSAFDPVLTLADLSQNEFVSEIRNLHTVDLLMEFYKKRPDLYKQFYIAFCHAFGVNSKSLHYSFIMQRIVAEKLTEIVRANPSPNNITLFVRVAADYLKLVHKCVEDGSTHRIYRPLLGQRASIVFKFNSRNKRRVTIPVHKHTKKI